MTAPAFPLDIDSSALRIVRDPSYAKAIDALIPQAEEIANREVGESTAAVEMDPNFARRWTEAFHTAIDQLAVERGLRKASWLAR